MMIPVVPIFVALLLQSHAAGSTDCARIRLEITAERRTLHVGERPRVTAAIINDGDSPVVLVRPGDGSAIGWRSPRVWWSVNDRTMHSAAPPIAAPQAGGRSGNINALHASEVFSLARGERETFSEWLEPPGFLAPGSYDLVLHYENDPQMEWKGLPLGAHDPAAMQQVRRSVRCALTSNALAIQVRGDPPR